MAQKALKTLAAKNTSTLNRTHLISLSVNLLFLLLRFFVFTNRSLLRYILLSFPALVIEFWFERIGRPTYTDTANGKDLKRAGEDLEAKGLTEWMWDVVYWTWACILLAAVLGNWAWWLYVVVPLYSAWLAFSTFTGVRQGMGGLTGGGVGGGGSEGGASQSKRQAKMEKRGGQKVQYR